MLRTRVSELWLSSQWPKRASKTMLVVMNDECMRMRIASALLGCTWSVLSALFCCRWCVASSLLRTRVAELWLSSQWAKRASTTMLLAINDACLCIHLLYPPLCIPPLHLCLLMSLYHAPPPLSHTGSFQHTEQAYLSSSTGRFSICRNGITGQFSIFRNGIKPTGVDPRPLCAFVFGNKSRVLMYPSALVPSLHLCVSLPCSSPPPTHRQLPAHRASSVPFQQHRPVLYLPQWHQPDRCGPAPFVCL